MSRTVVIQRRRPWRFSPLEAIEGFLGDVAELLKPRTIAALWRKVMADDVPGLSAEVAYYALFALFPFLLFVASLAGLLVGDPEQAMVSTLLLVHRFLPSETASLLASFVGTTLRSNRPDLLSIGILGTLWACSQGFNAVIKALNRIHGLKENRGWLRHRAISLLMVIGAGLVALALLIVMLGADPGGLLSRWLAMPPRLVILWGSLRWPAAFFVLTIVLALIYCEGPCRRGPWRWITPGGLIVSVLWVVISAALTMWVDNFGWYNVTYGAIGGVIILLTWLYLGAFLLLLGAEINVVLAARARGAKP